MGSVDVNANIQSLPSPIGPVAVEGAAGSPPIPVMLGGIPTTFDINIDKLPKIQLGIDPITLNPVQASLTIDKPVALDISINKLPDIRAHIPADFTVSMCVLGMDLLSVRMCGEAQMITEPYHPGPCELVGEPERIELNPLPQKEP